MDSQKVLPTSEVVDKIFHRYVSGRDLNGELFKKQEKTGKYRGEHFLWNGKLQPHDIDMIRCLATLSVKNVHIQEYFGVKMPIGNIIDHQNFSKHLSPFEVLGFCSNISIDNNLLTEFKEEYSEEIKDFYRFCYEYNVKRN